MFICKNKSSKGMRVIITHVLLLFFVFQIFMTPVWAAEQKEERKAQDNVEKNVLVLQSYHRGHVWSDGQGNAIIDALINSDMKVSVSLEYMDWKRYPDEQNLSLLYDRLQYKYEKKKIDLIVTTDDAALKFALENRAGLFSDAPIVFSGVMAKDAALMLEGHRNVTGVYQVMDPKGTIQAARKMIPGFKKIYIVHDNSESGTSIGFMINEAALEIDRGIQSTDLSKFSLEQLLDQVKGLDKNSIVFLASYNSDINNEVWPMQDLAKKISEASSVPVFTIEEGTFGYGSIGGSLTSASEHGKAAAELGIRILRGEPADSIAIIDRKTVYWGFDYKQLERFGIPEERLPEGSKIIDRPFSFFETYKTFVISNIAIILILLVFTIFLLVNLKYRKMTEETLKRQKEENYNLAYYSPVTGLPNRINLKEKLEKIISSDVEEKKGFFLIYIDIDNFKEVNDTFGHSVGDRILHAFAQRLGDAVGENDYAFSLGGDEFILLIRNEEKKAVEKTVALLLESFKKPFLADDNTFHMSASGGIVCFPDHGDNYIELLKNADTAMYRSKEAGKGNFTYFDQSMSDEAVQKTKMQSHLRQALEQGGFVLYYQPQLNVKTGKIWGYEALIRWSDPVFGFVHPLSFIKIAEESRLIIPIGEWVLETACRFIKHVHEVYKTECVVSVNISVIQFLQESFVENVLDTLKQVGLAPRYLELEITETVFLHSSKSAIEKMERLREAGIRIALDDFGTGYSSLSYLSQLPITTLKIDKAFIRSIFESSKNMVLTNTIIKMGHAMGLELVVEGVETKSQRDLFTQLGCDRIQGYHVSKPLPVNEIFEFSDRYFKRTAVHNIIDLHHT